MTDSSRAVFLSYASQDAEAAQRICAALRAAGIEVWLDQAELRGGDAWDHEIRRQIHDCALFLPVISANTAVAMAYEKMARYTDAKAELAKARAELGDAAAYQYAWVYTQWGDRPKALEWLEAALHPQDPGLTDLKVEPLLDPLRSEPRFQAVQRALKFPP
ncbi:MAG: toll/interleukin-1 receptor domain-containing protein [Gammaproteobacteria bacterium]|nr:toll/interleukin-1 receptor domain-containing protein [Gammaproteobacteria bacterium]